ncbi:MAG TPA: phosphatidylserine decarboxylase family protein [Gemmatimonadales bacterium]|nr:phosphatidylserine decarboxylase family protein [Gemmatimonadales bacterium]
MIRTAPEGRWFIAAAVAIAVVLAALGHWYLLLAWLPIAIWVVAFFRDPIKAWALGERNLIAPADGRVVSVVEVDEPAFFGGRATRVSIFMNVFDCHVNRYPCDGVVAYRHYNPGRFGHAGTEKASLDNEQSSVGLETPRGKVLIRQIAGLVARRIVTDDSVGHQAKQGERMGMIRFGSRVDLFLPVDTEILVRVDDKTKVGQTVVARWP